MAVELRQERRYTFEEYLEIDDGNKYELRDGILYMMSAPFDPHVVIGGQLIAQLIVFFRGKTCQVKYDSNVRLWKDKDTTYVPDISVICDPSKINNFGCVGAPDFIIEIISPSTARMDYLVKHKDYQDSGVKEYWIIDPKDKKVDVNILIDGKYELTTYTFDNVIDVRALPGCELDFTIFKEYNLLA